MNIIEAVKDMSNILNPSADALRKALEEDYHVIVGDKNNYGYDMLTYDLFIEDGVLYVGRLSDSSKDEIVISLEMAAIYDGKIIDMLWSSYLSGKDVFIIDTIGHMHEAHINSGQFTLDTIKSELRPGQIVYLNDTYSNPHVSNHPDTKVYIEDNTDAPICGMDAVKTAVETVVNTKIITNKNAADFTILILPNVTKAPHKKFYEWLDDSTKDIPVVAETLTKKKMAYKEPHKILLYWSSNVVMAGLFDPNRAMYNAAMELDDAIKSYHEG